MVDAKPAGGGQKLAATGNAEEKTHIVPVHWPPLMSKFAQWMCISAD
jgi:hypothetical protein